MPRYSESTRLSATRPIELPVRWQPRHYQHRAWNALTGKGAKRVVLVWHRRAGKDLVLLNATVLAAVRRAGVYWHIFPTAKQGRKILWDGLTRQGRPFLDHWPHPLVVQRNETDMKLKLANGSVWQVVGADNFNQALIGGNPAGLVFSEYALQKPACWQHLRPILSENGGWAAFAFTPRGPNHGQELFDMAAHNPDWFAERLTVDDTKAISPAEIERERAAGMPDELVRQEYYCSFAAALVGSYYGKLIEQAEDEGRIARVELQRCDLVETWWDLGIGDSTAIWFVARAGAEVRVLDFYEASGEGLDHYAAVLRDKGYKYHRHVFPHDVAVREIGSGRSRIETLRTLGVVGANARAEIAPNMRVAEGINAVRTLLPHCWFDAEKCAAGLRALRSYQRRWNETRRTFEEGPLHDWTSHAADAFRYGALRTRTMGARRPQPPPGWRPPEAEVGNAYWPPWDWGEPDFPRVWEEREAPPYDRR